MVQATPKKHAVTKTFCHTPALKNMSPVIKRNDKLIATNITAATKIDPGFQTKFPI